MAHDHVMMHEIRNFLFRYCSLKEDLFRIPVYMKTLYAE